MRTCIDDGCDVILWSLSAKLPNLRTACGLCRGCGHYRQIVHVVSCALVLYENLQLFTAL